jgi:hypothetical protein
MKWLQNEVRRFGGTFVQRRVTSFDEEDCDLLVTCTGAEELMGFTWVIGLIILTVLFYVYQVWQRKSWVQTTRCIRSVARSSKYETAGLTKKNSNDSQG